MQQDTINHGEATTEQLNHTIDQLQQTISSTNQRIIDLEEELGRGREREDIHLKEKELLQQNQRLT